jgi:tetratricopeptide (TPR) repeat protein
VLNDSIDIILFQNNYYRTELGVKFDYGITAEIIDIIHGEKYSLPKKSIAKELGFIIGHDGIEMAINAYPILKGKDNYFTDENELNQLGNELYQNYGMKNESFKIFELAISEYPDSFLLNYSYGELLSENDNQKAIDCYKRCVDLYDNNSENNMYSQEYEKSLKKIK